MNFINDDFLLENKSAQKLYHDIAKDLPIIDYHNHLSPGDISEDRQFKNISEVWISEDHYKWRAMRTLGVEEKYITGNGSDADKFQQWANCLPYTLRNPLFHWSQLELARYFNVFDLLNGKNASTIYQKTSEQLQQPQWSCRSLIKKMNLEILCTTEDPTDDLKHHQFLSQSDFSVKVKTSFRPDKAILIEGQHFNDYIDTLAAVCDIDIQSVDDLYQALSNRIEYFHKNGCRLSDHGLTYIPYETVASGKLNTIFIKKRTNKELSPQEVQQFHTAILLFLSKEYHRRGWVQQFHLGAMRNNNSRKFHDLGSDTGWDSIGTYPIASGLAKFLNHLDTDDQLTKTILYNLNPADNAMMATMIGNFNDGSSKGKIQWGSGWWFLDQLDGMTDQINTLSNMGLVSCFIGMLTDSRSFLSFPRHEYFRRLICNIFGNEIEKGLLPNDPKWVGKIIADICYYNAKDYFDFNHNF